MHNKGDAMSDVVGIAGDRIRSFVERIQQIETEFKDLTEAKKEIIAEAKGEGFDVKALKEIIRRSATNTRACSTSTWGRWMRLHQFLPRKPHDSTHRSSVAEGRPTAAFLFSRLEHWPVRMLARLQTCPSRARDECGCQSSPHQA
jgi:uncharacterized protein (UPF0335 family)